MNSSLLSSPYDASTTSYVLDVNSIGSLKANANSPEAIKKIASQVEGLFLQMMLKSMRDATPKDDLLSSNQTQLFTSLYDQQISQDLSNKGIGFANELVKAMEQNSLINPDDLELNSEKQFSLVETLQSQSFDGKPESINSTNVLNIVRGSLSRENINNLSLKFTSIPTTVNNAVSDVVEGATEFVKTLSMPAQLASKDSGIHHQLILAQAALESGWGKHEIKAANGNQSHNLFGIKAGKNWKGDVTEVLTTEFIDGQPTKVRAKFRVYQSYQHALSDYVDLLTQNPRYKNVISASSPEQAAIEIQKAGYATDPQYASKLINIIKKFKTNQSIAVKHYTNVNNIKI